MGIPLQLVFAILTGLSTHYSLHVPNFDDTADNYFHGPQKSPDGKWIAFTRIKRFSNPEAHGDWVDDISLYIRNRKTHQTRRLVRVKGRGGVPVTAGWSPDSKRVLYWRLGYYGAGSINADGSGLRDVSITSGRSRVLGFARRERGSYVFSPNGRFLCVIEGGDRHLVTDKRIAVLDYKTGGKHWGSAEHMASINPAWSPDSNYLTYTSTDDAHPLGEAPDADSRTVKFHLWVARRDGGGKQLTFDRRYHEGTPKWSPDGKAIRFERVENIDAEPRTYWEIQPDGSGLKQLKGKIRNRPFKPGSGTRPAG